MVLSKGPWFIGEHFLSVRPWEANFNPEEANITSIAVWIRLPRLPIEYYDIEALKEIGSVVGRVLRVDTYTASEARGRYARLCVQVNINNPLIYTIMIGKFKQFVIYEGIGRLCFSCGCVGHRWENCCYTIQPPQVSKNDNLGDACKLDGEVRTSKEGGNPTTTLEIGHPEDLGTTPILDASVLFAPDQLLEENYGPWLVVTRKRQGNRNVKKLGEATSPISPHLIHSLPHKVSGLSTNVSQPKYGKRKVAGLSISPNSGPQDVGPSKELNLKLSALKPTKNFKGKTSNLQGRALSLTKASTSKDHTFLPNRF